MGCWGWVEGWGRGWAGVRSSKPVPRRNALAASSPVPALAAHQRASTDGPSSCTTRTRGSERCSKRGRERCSKRGSKRVSKRGSTRCSKRGREREALRGSAGHLHHENLAVGAQHLLTAVVQRPGEARRAVPAVVHRLTCTCIPLSWTATQAKLGVHSFGAAPAAPAPLTRCALKLQ